ncbi:hypothetical protein TrLO_g4408 [Triparma laevis f. longispina]|uniref:J domain-containing protein n=1 Tax=Triparma laevis f. longispina TaxID=1714387 RepID=A0A9W6ZLF7_9STRA|nr:hypothetical protein TrLO_g4408 [Triparma laevis f. longispina]
MKSMRWRPNLLLLLVLLSLLCSTSAFLPRYSTRFASRPLFLSREPFAAYTGPPIDLYRILELRRTATDDEIKSGYKKIARTKHPDVTASKFRFEPSDFNVRELTGYLNDNGVGTSNYVEKSEYIASSLEVYKRTSNIPSSLQTKIDKIADEFNKVTTAYMTLSDPAQRRMYDLTGDWGLEKEYIPDSGDKSIGERMGDRSEAARVRRRKGWEQKDEMQRRVYEQNMIEKEEKERELEAIREKGEELRARQREVTQQENERNRRKFENAFKRKGGGDGEKEKIDRHENEADGQDKIKAKWGEIFKNIGF